VEPIKNTFSLETNKSDITEGFSLGIQIFPLIKKLCSYPIGFNEGIVGTNLIFFPVTPKFIFLFAIFFLSVTLCPVIMVVLDLMFCCVMYFTIWIQKAGDVQTVCWHQYSVMFHLEKGKGLLLTLSMEELFILRLSS